MRIVFMGTPDFAVFSLEALIEAGHDVCAVFTQPDKPRGRKQVMTPPEVKLCAEKHHIPVYQPTTLRDEKTLAAIESLQPDVIVVAAYGKILPKAILDYPRFGCVNVHASLLPKYRGAAPIQRAVLDGEKETGVTIQQMNEGIDTGDILFSKKIPIETDDTSASMFEKLSRLGAATLTFALEKIERGEVNPQKQDDSLSTYAPMIDKSLCEIDWTKSAEEIHNLIRGLYDWPIAHTTYQGKKLKIFSSVPDDSRSGQPGEVLSLDPLTVACGTGSLNILELQLEGKRRMDARSFSVGHSDLPGTVFPS